MAGNIFESIGDTIKTAVDIKDEGVLIANNIDTINIVGVDHIASGTNEVTITHNG